MDLTNRERYVRLMKGEPVDRAPFFSIFGPWGATIDRWKQEGLAAEATWETIAQIVGFEAHRGYQLPVNGFLCPGFEPRVLEESQDRRIIIDHFGVQMEDRKDQGSMPRFVSFAVANRRDWEEIKWRLDPDAPGRVPANWAEICRASREQGDPVFVGDLPIGFFGGPRQLMGLENLLFLMYDDPALIHEILDTLCDLWIAVYTRVQREAPLDYFFVWEDMCFKNGPLIGPGLFREFLLPRYQRLTRALREAGVEIIMVDSDGDVRQLVPLWLEGGVTLIFPWETQMGLDITEVRRQYPTLQMVGGLNKAVLAHDRTAMDRELEKVPFMLESGRYLPAVDHFVPPDVSWDNYRYFYERLRELIWRPVQGAAP